LKCSQCSVYTLALSANDSVLVTGSADGHVNFWNLSQEMTTSSYETSQDQILNETQEISEADSNIFCENDHGITIIKTCDDSSAHETSNDAESENSIKFSPVAIVKQDRCTKFTLQWHYCHTRDVYCLAISNDENLVVSGSWDGYICIWNGKLQQLNKIKAHNKPVSAVAIFCDDNNHVVSASHDNTVRVWKTVADISTMISEITVDAGCGIYSMQLSSNNKFVVVGCDNRSIQMFQI